VISITFAGSAYCAPVGRLRCVDGSSLVVIPVPSRDRGGTPYEITLELERDGAPFGSVGERCGHVLAALSRLLAAARCDDSQQASAWPEPDDRFPDPPLERALRATGCGHDLGPHMPKERELFAFRCRDRGDLASTGELRCSLRTSCCWIAAQPSGANGTGQWRVARRAVVEAWGASGRGVRAVLTSGELAGFLTDVLREAERAGTSYRDLTDGALSRRSR
jgi:hypothetical protein